MGDICDMNDLERFMRCPEGKEALGEIRKMLIGRKITEVEFTNEIHCIGTSLHFDDNEVFVLFQPSLDVGVVRMEFGEVIEREYYVDFPERKPSKEEPSCT